MGLDSSGEEGAARAGAVASLNRLEEKSGYILEAAITVEVVATKIVMVKSFVIRDLARSELL